MATPFEIGAGIVLLAVVGLLVWTSSVPIWFPTEEYRVKKTIFGRTVRQQKFIGRQYPPEQKGPTPVYTWRTIKRL